MRDETQIQPPARHRVVPDWPVLMTARTLASYLDCADDNGNLNRKFKEWRDAPGFPQPDPRTGKYYRPAIDSFLARHYGYAAPIETAKAELDEEFAN